MTWRRAARLSVGVVISGVCLWLAVRQAPLEQVGAALRQARLGFLLPALIALCLDVITRAMRWAILLRPVARVSWRQLLSPTIIGYMGNALLPARLGELLRATLLGQALGNAATGEARIGDWTSAALGNIALERVLDGLTVVVILAATAWFVPHPDWLTAGLAGITALSAGALIALGLLVAFQPVVMGWLRRSLGRFAWTARLFGWADRFLGGLQALRDPRLMALALAFNLAVWLFSVLEYYWVFRAFDLPLGLPQAAFLMAALGLVMVIPSAPAALGTFELAGVALLGVMGVGEATALSFTVVMHLLLYAPLLVAGLLLLWRTGYFLPKQATTRG